MKKSGLSAFIMLLFASNRNACSAFISEWANFANDYGRELPDIQYIKKQSYSPKAERSLDELKCSVDYAQQKLEDFSHGFVISRKNNGNMGESGEVTFVKLRGTSSQIYYNGQYMEEGYMPSSITGKFNGLEKMGREKKFASPFVVSNGAKSFDRTLEKILKNPGQDIHDSARLSVFTRKPEELYEFCSYIFEHHSRNKENSIFGIDEESPVIVKEWSRKNSGFFSAKLNVPINTENGKIYSEIMFVPEHKKSRMATDLLSHTAYEVARKDNSGFYNKDALRKWNVVVREVQNNRLTDLDGIIGDEVRAKNGIGAVTARDFDIYKLKSLFNSYGKYYDSPIERRKTEMSMIQKELNKKAMEDICRDENWNPERIERMSENYSLPKHMVRFAQVNKYQGCEISYPMMGR
ncbi:MAG: hypothetical protein PQ612_02135 [Rickettsiales bacterium]|nr:hypothetical protein [Pseudomonadota bacterium]MDA0967075.1 hypothetical protein [Pseudomonadota bacterium]MDG4542439.1 hypothetical protein [Rickettsiales bacterium]MDG4544943.1 hypothetical protein [Rickettsiales bacterium]MDG4547066.1 hypothetical protein [Rickettsiales bacterium]